MKKFILYCLFVCTAFVAQSQVVDDDLQSNPQKEEKVKALYVAYMTQQLKLTPDEAQKFWPIHAQYDAELRAINKSGLSEIDREDAEVKVKKKYVASFTKVLGADRCNKFSIHDNQFRDKIKARLREMRQQRRQQMQQDGGNRPQGGGRRKLNGGQ